MDCSDEFARIYQVSGNCPETVRFFPDQYRLKKMKPLSAVPSIRCTTSVQVLYCRPYGYSSRHWGGRRQTTGHYPGVYRSSDWSPESWRAPGGVHTPWAITWPHGATVGYVMRWTTQAPRRGLGLTDAANESPWPDYPGAAVFMSTAP